MTTSTWRITTLPDEPIDEAELFGFQEISDKLVEFLLSPETITPFAIALHGEWGGGKSSLLYTTKKKLESVVKKESKNVKVVYFDAWAYEGTDPASALVYSMMEPLETHDIKGTAISIALLAVDVLSRKTLNMDLQAVKSHFDQYLKQVSTLRDQINQILKTKLTDGRLIILIDDLDRCSLDNTLAILDGVKLFLSLQKCLFVVAVDMNKLELAWKSRYGYSEEITKEGNSYLEKIFQMRVGIPAKTREDIIEYIKKMVNNIPPEFADIIASVGLNNPRNIKRLLNLSSFRALIGNNKTRKLELALLWSLLEELIGREKSVLLYNSAGAGGKFIELLLKFKDYDYSAYKQLIHKDATFGRVQGLPSNKDLLTYEYFTKAGKILDSFHEDKDVLGNSLAEIVDSANEFVR